MRSPVRIWIAAPAQDTSKPEGFGVFLFCGRGCKASPLGRGVCEADGEGKPGRTEPPRSDKLSLCQSDAIAAPVLLHQRPCPLRRFAPALPRGEPLAGRGAFCWKPKVQYNVKSSALLSRRAGHDSLFALWFYAAFVKEISCFILCRTTSRQPRCTSAVRIQLMG